MQSHDRAPRRPAPPGTAIAVEDLYKSFGANQVLNGISLAVAPHEVICLIGASGSGKSTLLRCVNLLEPISSGRICLLGQDVTAPGVNADAVRRQVGIVFQSYNLFPHMTVLRNVTLAPTKALRRPRRQAEEAATELLARFGLADKRQEYPDRLSGGQQQRVAIVRALAMQPQVLLLDEVTSALDPELVAEVLDVIRELAAGRDDHADRYPRDGLRPRHRESGLLPGGGQDHRGRSSGRAVHRAQGRPHPPVPAPDRRRGPPVAPFPAALAPLGWSCPR